MRIFKNTILIHNLLVLALLLPVLGVFGQKKNYRNIPIVDTAIGNPRIQVSIDRLLAFDRAQASQLVADHVQLEVAAFAFNFDPGSRQLFFKEVLNFYGLHAQPQSAPCARGSAIIQKSPSPANPVNEDSDRGARRAPVFID